MTLLITVEMAQMRIITYAVRNKSFILFPVTFSLMFFFLFNCISVVSHRFCVWNNFTSDTHTVLNVFCLCSHVCFKGMDYPKIKILSKFTYLHVFSDLYGFLFSTVWSTKERFFFFFLNVLVFFFVCFLVHIKNCCCLDTNFL